MSSYYAETSEKMIVDKKHFTKKADWLMFKKLK